MNPIKSILVWWLIVLGAHGDEQFFVVNGHQYSREQVEAEYQSVMKRYALTPHKNEIGSLESLGGKLLEGQVLRISGARLILSTGEGPVAVMMKGGHQLDGKQLTLAVKELGKYSYRSSTGARASIPQYRDITLTRSEFMHALRRGYPFSGMKVIKNQRREISQMKKGGSDGFEGRSKSQFERRRTEVKRK